MSSPTIPQPLTNGTTDDADRFMASLPGTASPEARAIAVTNTSPTPTSSQTLSTIPPPPSGTIVRVTGVPSVTQQDAIPAPPSGTIVRVSPQTPPATVPPAAQPPNDYLSNAEDVIHNTIQGSVSNVGAIGHDILSAAGAKYQQITAQAQAVHDAALREFKAGNYAKAVGIITSAHASALTNSPLTGYIPQIAGQVYDYGKSIINPAIAAGQKAVQGDLSGAGHSLVEAQGNAAIPGAGTHIARANELLRKGDHVGAQEALGQAGLDTALFTAPALGADSLAGEGARTTGVTHIYDEAADSLIPVATGDAAATAEKLADRVARREEAAATAASQARDAAKVTPVDQAVTKGVKKSGLTEGTPEAPTPSEATKVQQADVSDELRSSVNKIAEQEGLEPVNSKSVRDIGKDLGDQFYTRSKAMFAKVQEATGVDLNGLQQDIKTLNEKIADDAGEDPERVGKLIETVDAKQAVADKAFEQAKGAGLDVEQARSDWKKFNAAYDFGNHVRLSTTGRAGMGATGIETVDPTKMAPRLHKLYDSNSPTQPGRLQQLAGDSISDELLNTVETHRDIARVYKDFVPESATGKDALAELIRRNTQGKASLLGKKVTGVTDWNGVVKDFENIGREEQDTMFKGTDGQGVAKLRQFLGRKAATQNAWALLKGKTPLGKAVRYGLGVMGGEEVIRRSLK